MSIQTSTQLDMPFPDPNTQILTFKNSVYQSDTSLVINDVRVKGGNVINTFIGQSVVAIG